MKTLVRFEAFNGKLKSEPEVWNIGDGMRIILPFTRLLRFTEVDRDQVQKPIVSVATFEFSHTEPVSGWEYPIRVYRMVDV